MRGFVPDDVWAAGRVASLPVHWQGQLLRAWEKRHPGDRRGANTALRETVDKLTAVRIPLDAGETQCWEIMASVSNDERYLVYIDTTTGIEKTILRIMQDDEGIVTQ